MGRKAITYEIRKKIKKLLDQGYSTKQIAQELGFHTTTIYKELKYGTDENGYNPNITKMKREENFKRFSRQYNEMSPELAKYIADMILKEGMSVHKIEAILKKENILKGSAMSRETIYRHIRKGNIQGVTMETLKRRETKIYRGGQMRIPKWLLDEVGIKEEDYLQIEVTKDGALLLSRKEREQQQIRYDEVDK